MRTITGLLVLGLVTHCLTLAVPRGMAKFETQMKSEGDAAANHSTEGPVRPAAAKPETAMVHNAAKPEPAMMHNAAKPEPAMLHNAAKPEPAMMHNAAKPEAGTMHNAAKKPEMGMNDAAKPEAAMIHNAAKPEAGTMHNAAKKPEMGMNDAAKPEAVMPNDAKPDAANPPKVKDAVAENFLSEGTSQLSTTLLTNEAENRTNLVFSPLGYSVILSLLSEGSRGRTRNQITSYLRIPEDTYAFRTTYKNILTPMQVRNTLNQPEFRNWFYVYRNCSVQEAYKQVLSENYLTEVKEIDRVPELNSDNESMVNSQQEVTTTEDNSKPLEEVDTRGEGTTVTVAENEKKMAERKSRKEVEREIMSAISANRLSSSEDNSTAPESRMIVFNALYYRGRWANQFTEVEGGTEFECSDGSSKSVPSIQSTGEYEFGRLRQLRASAINIPYEGGRYALLVILPERGESLPSLLKRLPKISLNMVDNQLAKRQVKVTLPKFKYYTITRPKEALIREGVEDVFGGNADLSGITGERGLYLDDLVQLVSIDVSQESSSYNFLTSTIGLRNAVPEFTAQRPFIYYLRDRIDNYVVVAGKVENPLAQGNH